MTSATGKILLVDDEPLVLEVLGTLFRSRGYQVVTVPSALEALGQLQRLSFDCVVCDVMMEGLDGFDLLAVARRKAPETAFLLVTGAPSPVDSERANRAGALYLSKPLGAEFLLRAVKSAIAERQNRSPSEEPRAQR